jgi:hypothetical protein
LSGIDITNFVLAQRAALFTALAQAGIDISAVVEKVDKRHPFGNWKYPVEVWQKPALPSEKGKHLANYWLTYPAKGSGKTVKFNLSTFETISQWLSQPNQPKSSSPVPPASQKKTPSNTTADTSLS